MKAIDARQLAYLFYKDQIVSILNKIATESGLGGMSIELDELPVAIEYYLLENDFKITRLTQSIIYLSWEL